MFGYQSVRYNYRLQCILFCIFFHHKGWRSPCSTCFYKKLLFYNVYYGVNDSFSEILKNMDTGNQ